MEAFADKQAGPAAASAAGTTARGEATRDAIRRAAEALFAAQGFSAVSMRDIAARVGVRASALYNHFPAKQDILAELMETHLLRLTAALDAVLPGAEASPAARLAAFARFHVRYHFDAADAVFLSYMELRSLAPENRARINALRGAYERRLRDILRDGQRSGAFRIEDPTIEAMALIAMLTGVTTWYDPAGRLSREAIEDIYVAMAARSVGLDHEEEASCSSGA
ncbi:TetR/AcrR family transcriptional regulator [Antarcticirhabdus aurantiaca]|uniref:TetR/AcrR family transcriptional regulator n=1 Tax=Antarcticirhabdus aurantiaca TaxID=2606717 RepID=A0ACD4NP98_9HYPH|nr:TetR/AcrR family transcriptional regulator [Antarcticirhabdus aurantiaca]WAJ28594.1 TetR/AcrR family transcriptional regulator [Jeongeuplla avenae]